MKGLVIWVALLATSLALAAPDKAREKAVRGIDEQFARAMENSDRSALDRILDENVVIVTSHGRVLSKRQLQQAIASGKSRPLRHDFDWEDVKLHGDTAVVTERMHLKGTSHDDPLDHWLLFTRIYRQKGGTWKMISYHASREDVPRGAKPAKPARG